MKNFVLFVLFNCVLAIHSFAAEASNADKFCSAVRESVLFLNAGDIVPILDKELARSDDYPKSWLYSLKATFPGQLDARMSIVDGVLGKTVLYQIYLAAEAGTPSTISDSLTQNLEYGRNVLQQCLAGSGWEFLVDTNAPKTLHRWLPPQDVRDKPVNVIALGIVPVTQRQLAIMLELGARIRFQMPGENSGDEGWCC